MKDADIDYSDIPPLDKTFLEKVTTAWPPTKKQLTHPHLFRPVFEDKPALYFHVKVAGPGNQHGD